MKRLLVLLIATTMLVACSDDANETENKQLEDFINEYNENAKMLNDSGSDNPHIESISIEGVEEPREENNRVWQQLLETQSENSDYSIDLKYDDDMNINGYHIGIDGHGDNGHYYNAGISSAIIISQMLELDPDLFSAKIKEFLNQEEVSLEYTDNGYNVYFMKMNFVDTGTLVIDFSKLE